MTEGTSQGLFVVVAIVIFGIFVGLAYTVFGKDGLSNDLKGIFESGTEQATDSVNGVVERTLLDLNTINIDILTNGFILDKDIENNSLALESTLGRSGGIKIPTAGLLKGETSYILEFDMEVVSGTVNSIGGHFALTHDMIIKIDDVVVKPELTRLSDWSMGITLPEPLIENDSINVKVLFNTPKDFSDTQYEDEPIKIQPNRLWDTENSGYGSKYKVNLKNISFLEMKREELKN